MSVPTPDFQALFESAPGSYLVLTPDFTIVAVTEAYLRATMTKREEILGRELFEVFPDNPDEPSTTEVRNLRASLESVLQNRTSHTSAVQKYDIRRPDSEGGGFEERYWSSVNSPVLGKDGQIAYIIHRVEDVTELIRTERKRSQEALQRSEERFHLLLENVKDYAIFFLDAERRITRWNLGAERILGYQEAEILGQSGSIIFTPEDREQGEDKQEIDKAEAEGRAENERWHVRKDGSRFWGSGIVTPLRDETGELRGFAKIMRDATERKQAEDERNQLLAREQKTRAEAEAANRLKDEFLAVLSHELRTPLNPILGWSKLLRSRTFDQKTADRALETIERNAKLQIQLIEDLLDVSRILQGKLSLNICPVALANTIEAARETVSLVAQAKSIQIETVFDPLVGMVAGDPNRLQQVVWNLLSNAVKFTPQGGRVEVRLERIGSQAQIKVTDTGKGISRDFLPHVFDYFRQSDSSTTRVFGGLGLGLGIVRHLVELHGGTVWAESPGEGQGTTFSVRLPLLAIAPQTKEDSTQPVRCLDFSDLKILVVDDEVDSREFVSFVLEECGAVVTAAASAPEALEALTLLKPDLLVSDIGMPEKDGYMLMRQIRAMPPEQGGEIPALALSAYASNADSEQALAAGFQKHLAKPVEPTQLIAVVATLIRRSRFT